MSAQLEEHVRALIVGIDSQIGSALAEALRQADMTVVGTSRRASSSDNIMLDLARPDFTLLPTADIVFLCAAETQQAACRNAPQETYRVNVEAPVAIAKFFSGSAARVVFTSSNAVFDGSIAFRRADDPVCPISVYGQQKAEAERKLQALGSSVAIARLTKTVPIEYPLFRKWALALRAGNSVEAFGDMVMAPLPSGKAAEALIAVAVSRAGGIFQVSGRRDIIYAEAAHIIARSIGADPALVVLRLALDAGIPRVELPAHTTLDDSRIRAMGGEAPPDPAEIIRQIADFAFDGITAAPPHPLPIP